MRKTAIGTKLKQIVRRTVFRCADVAGVNFICRRRNRGKLMVICYHGVCDDDFELLKGFSERHLAKSQFRRQMEYLVEQGYTFVSLSEAVAALRSNRPLVPGLVTLTFDDGFRNVIRNAYPIMREFGAKGCIYVVSGLVGTNGLLWSDWVECVVRDCPRDELRFAFEGDDLRFDLRSRLLREHTMTEIKRLLRTVDDDKRREYLRKLEPEYPISTHREFSLADWAELRVMDPDILEVGSHTCSHPSLTQVVRDEVLDEEIGKSKRVIEEAIGRPVVHFSYPRSAHNARVRGKVREYGYVSAVTLTYGLNGRGEDPLLLKRVDGSGTLADFKANVSGVFSVYKALSGWCGRRSGDPAAMVGYGR